MIDFLLDTFANMNSFLSFMGTVIGVHGFEKFIISPQRRENIGSKIEFLTNKNISLGQGIDSSFNFFESWFGTKHLSWRCIFMSTFFTLLFTLYGFLLIVFVFSKGDFDNITSLILYKENYKFLVIAILINIIIDYVSLAETRFIINRIKNETSFIGITIFLLIDALLTFFIFIILFSLFKSILDFILILPTYHEHKEMVINHGENISVLLNTSDGHFTSFINYFTSIVKFTIISSWHIFEHGLKEYWFSSLFLPESGNTYTIHTSTIWLTTHFSSIYIYIIAVLWVLVRSPLRNLKLPWFTPYELDPKSYPLTVTLINITIGLISLLIGALIYKYIGWLGLIVLVSLLIIGKLIGRP